jgi:hypothetical protein
MLTIKEGTLWIVVQPTSNEIVHVKETLRGDLILEESVIETEIFSHYPLKLHNTPKSSACAHLSKVIAALTESCRLIVVPVKTTNRR